MSDKAFTFTMIAAIVVVIALMFGITHNNAMQDWKQRNVISAEILNLCMEQEHTNIEFVRCMERTGFGFKYDKGTVYLDDLLNPGPEDTP